MREVEIAERDLLVIDTRHDDDQLREELRLHAGKVRRYVVLHDTTTDGERGETSGRLGPWPAVEEFLARGGGTITLSAREVAAGNSCGDAIGRACLLA